MDMNLKKTVGVSLTAVLAVGLIAGCSNSNNGGSTSTPTATPKPAESTNATTAPEEKGNEPVTIKWALWDWEATAYYEPLIKAYTDANPHVTIEYIDLGSTDYMTMLSTQLSGGADLDVLQLKTSQVMRTLLSKIIWNRLMALLVKKAWIQALMVVL